MNFLSFLARPGHLQLLSDEDYKKLVKEMPAALDVLYGNNKGRALSVGIFALRMIESCSVFVLMKILVIEMNVSVKI